MPNKALLMPIKTAAVCSAMSFLMCVFVRTIIVVISLSHISVNFNADELSLPNTEELVNELDNDDNEQLDDPNNSNVEKVFRALTTKNNNLITPRKRTRVPILEVHSYSELSYMIEKYRCVAVLYQDGSEVG